MRGYRSFKCETDSVFVTVIFTLFLLYPQRGLDTQSDINLKFKDIM